MCTFKFLKNLISLFFDMNKKIIGVFFAIKIRWNLDYVHFQISEKIQFSLVFDVYKKLN